MTKSDQGDALSLSVWL